MSRRLSFDIFCRVIDNFGDIGVCWRLARQLAHHHDVRLWVDDLHSFARIEPSVSTNLAQQTISCVQVLRWVAHMPLPEPKQVVIEAFACDPPADFIQKMAQAGSLWINLEYLSAEPWVESFHALPSLQASGVRKAFFFPGFTPGTGGLLRENGLAEERAAWQATPQARTDLLRNLRVASTAIEAVNAGALLVMLFCYAHAPASQLLAALQASGHSAVVLVPAGVSPGLVRGQHENVTVQEIPFVSQQGFDRLLWSCDLNCIRGEDSLVRALWAGKPLLWHIYPQDDDVHLLKLNAWLACSPFSEMVQQANKQWNDGNAAGFQPTMTQALHGNHWNTWKAQSARWSDTLASQPDLVTSLVDFCLKHTTKAKEP
ncbi:elongation factor P maturation arginine rhamnosyltransferase EarP [Pusillimonas sp. ANT_WB101]|uniref:elongation factor P maturation arginine rhamnosyltransferase EarP n=1 Tax=Pusillimonas sp. ANT_WB101 TaxID=2597356 RepID=UPI0011ECF613|nr:elongation factor P maturation arginine rhamnosyltransferase EarP [Pusillimonas sp. ANT_WB101]KAA0888560.1 elongation factor P maturation arginine rhamnosyltransferase EarP [Pusillimonas sp. ANT_WB101]